MKKMPEYYENGLCPDCGDDIKEDTQSGEDCLNCGHVFYKDEELEIN